MCTCPGVPVLLSTVAEHSKNFCASQQRGSDAMFDLTVRGPNLLKLQPN